MNSHYLLFIKRLLLVVFFCFGLILFFVFDATKYFNLKEIGNLYSHIINYADLHYYKAIAVYIGVYIVAVFLSIPIKPFLKIIGGLVFGLLVAFTAALFSATSGAMIVFICIKHGWGGSTNSNNINYYSKFKKLVQDYPVSLLLTSRLLPIPFFIPNILAGILQIKTSIFFFTTLIGIIPVTFIYVWLGTHLGESLSSDVGSFIDYKSILALTILGLLALLPILVNGYLNKNKS